ADLRRFARGYPTRRRRRQRRPGTGRAAGERRYRHLTDRWRRRADRTDPVPVAQRPARRPRPPDRRTLASIRIHGGYPRRDREGGPPWLEVPSTRYSPAGRPPNWKPP